MGSSRRYKKSRASKRGFMKKNTKKLLDSASGHWQQHEEESMTFSISDEKNEGHESSNNEEENQNEESGFYFIMNSDIFMSLFLMLCRCPDCDSTVKVNYLANKKRGFALCFSITCSRCSWKNIFCSSHENAKALI